MKCFKVVELIYHLRITKEGGLKLRSIFSLSSALKLRSLYITCELPNKTTSSVFKVRILYIKCF